MKVGIDLEACQGYVCCVLAGGGAGSGQTGHRRATLGTVYSLHKLLWDLRRDAALAERFRDDPHDVVAAYDLDPGDREAIAARDFAALYQRGANPYLLYFCALQIGVSRADYYAQLRGEA